MREALPARDQLGRMSHVMFGGLTHEPAVLLCDRLARITPAGLEHVFLCDSGSVSVEVAIKMCLQYWRSSGKPAKQKLLTWRGGYHGDTFWAMSVCDPDGGMHRVWDGVLPRQVFADMPPAGFSAGVDPGYAGQLGELIERHASELAAATAGTGHGQPHPAGRLHHERRPGRGHRAIRVPDPGGVKPGQLRVVHGCS